MNPNIELIERYLSGDLSNSEKETFEQALAQDSELQTQLEQVKQLKEGIQYKALKDLIGKGFKKFKLWKTVKLVAITMAVTVALVVGTYLALRKTHHAAFYPTINSDSLSFVKDHSEQMLSTELELQYVSMDNDLDTIIESRNGMIIMIPAGALVDEQGETVKGKVSYAFQEALEPEQIMLAGLSTTSDGKLLETGGMFQIAAHQNGKLLKINPDKKIMIKVPTDRQKPNMQLFKGEKNKDGRINWVNPQPLSPDLIPIDIESLDFYPPNYIKVLNDLGIYRNDKKYIDSLYYSFSGRKMDAGSKSRHSEHTMDCDPLIHRIEPATIKTIWNSEFNNTILATKEFEERLRDLHEIGKNEALELYINNLDKNMYEIDSMVSVLLKTPDQQQKFKNYEAQHLGKVQASSDKARLLAKFYDSKKQINQRILQKTYESFQRKRAALNKELDSLESDGYEKRNQHLAELVEEEKRFNTASVYKQLGINPCEKQTPNDYYTAEISDLDIYNIDRFVNDVSTNRTSGTYTQNGKTAKIKYQKWKINIKDSKTYDKILPYFVPDEVSSFLLAENFEVSLNQGMNYQFICIAMKDGNCFFYENYVDGTQLPVLKPIFQPISKTELHNVLSRKKSERQTALIMEDFENQFDQESVGTNLRKIEEWEDIMYRLQARIFPWVKAVISVTENQPCWLNQGKELFEKNCSSCHSLYKPMIGPALSGILYRRDESWVISFTQNAAKVIASGDPYANHLFTNYQSAGIMPPMNLKDEEIRSIIYYIMMEDFEGFSDVNVAQ